MLDDTTSMFRDELGPGEQLLWTGRPKGGLLLRSSDVFMIPFSLLWGGFAMFWEAGVIATGAPSFAALFGLPFVLVGLYMIAGRFFVDAWLRARTYYAVTDRRAIILSGLFSRSIRTLGVKSLGDISLSLKGDGRGTITLGAGNPMSPWGSGISWPGTNRYAPPAFEMIEDARRVYELLLRVQSGGA